MIYTTLEELPENYGKFKSILKNKFMSVCYYRKYFFCNNKNYDQILVFIRNNILYMYIWIDEEIILKCTINTQLNLNNQVSFEGYIHSDYFGSVIFESCESYGNENIYRFMFNCIGNPKEPSILFKYISSKINAFGIQKLFDVCNLHYTIEKTIFISKLDCFDSLQFDNEEERQIIEKFNSKNNSEFFKKVLSPKYNFID